MCVLLASHCTSGLHLREHQVGRMYLLSIPLSSYESIVSQATTLDTCHVSKRTLSSRLSKMTSLLCTTLPAQRLIHNDLFFAPSCSKKKTWELSIDHIVLDSACVFVPMSLDLRALDEMKSHICNKYCPALHIASTEEIALFQIIRTILLCSLADKSFFASSLKEVNLLMQLLWNS